MAQMGFYFNSDLCSGCKVCQIACKDANDLEAGTLFREVHEMEEGEYPNFAAYNLSMSCNHCASPACVAACPTGAMYKREDGVVMLDQELCDRCKKCVEVCPYGAPKYIAEKDMVGKCMMCSGRIQEGELPACVASCTMRALEYGDIEELRAKYGDNANFPGIEDASLTKPSVVFGLHRGIK